MANLLESMIGDGESLFLKTISRCLDSRHVDLMRACLITVTWLSSSLSKQYNAGLHLPAFLAIISHLKGILENGELELKTLASMSLFNFSKISGLAPSPFICDKNISNFETIERNFECYSLGLIICVILGNAYFLRKLLVMLIFRVTFKLVMLLKTKIFKLIGWTV